jgi:ATP-dependent RNA circularization protein (DNA/RNA ligase family)
LRQRGAVRTIGRVSREVVQRQELEAAIEARSELGAELEPQVIDAFVERIEQRLASQAITSEQSLKRRREHQREMVLGAMGISVPLLLIAAIFTGLPGVVAVCAALGVIAIVSLLQR